VLTLELEVNDKLAGLAHIINQGDTETKVFQTGNSWGDDALSFEIADGTRTMSITPEPKIYTRDVPSTVSIEPGSKYSISFYLLDETWKVDYDDLESLSAEARLTAIYQIGPSEEAVTQQTWTGSIRSVPVSIGRLSLD
jgi:hypothetical protein